MVGAIAGHGNGNAHFVCHVSPKLPSSRAVILAVMAMALLVWVKSLVEGLRVFIVEGLEGNMRTWSSPWLYWCIHSGLFILSVRAVGIIVSRLFFFDG